MNTKSKIELLPGSRICLTRLKFDKLQIENEPPITGILSKDGLAIGQHLEIVDEYKTRLIKSIFSSYTSIIIKTEDSIYLLEKLPWW